MKPSVSLIPLSTIYSAVTRMRLAAYQRGWFSVARLPVPVVSVGNLTTGGTGKTPLVEWVCRALANSGSASSREVTAERVQKLRWLSQTGLTCWQVNEMPGTNLFFSPETFSESPQSSRIQIELPLDNGPSRN